MIGGRAPVEPTGLANPCGRSHSEYTLFGDLGRDLFSDMGPPLMIVVSACRFGRIATRYDRSEANSIAALKLVSVRLWLRAHQSATSTG